MALRSYGWTSALEICFLPQQDLCGRLQHSLSQTRVRPTMSVELYSYQAAFRIEHAISVWALSLQHPVHIASSRAIAASGACSGPDLDNL